MAFQTLSLLDILVLRRVDIIAAVAPIYFPENLSSNTAANCACYRISKFAEINILGCTSNDISANGAADGLYD